MVGQVTFFGVFSTLGRWRARANIYLGWDIQKLRAAQISDDDEFKIRLSPLPRHREDSIHENGFITAGYLEVLGADADGYKWRKVCANGWTEKDSFVACGQLGLVSF